MTQQLSGAIIALIGAGFGAVLSYLLTTSQRIADRRRELYTQLRGLRQEAGYAVFACSEANIHAYRAQQLARLSQSDFESLAVEGTRGQVENEFMHWCGRYEGCLFRWKAVSRELGELTARLTFDYLEPACRAPVATFTRAVDNLRPWQPPKSTLPTRELLDYCQDELDKNNLSLEQDIYPRFDSLLEVLDRANRNTSICIKARRAWQYFWDHMHDQVVGPQSGRHRRDNKDPASSEPADPKIEKQ